MADQAPKWRKGLISGSNVHVHGVISSGITSAVSDPTLQKVLVYDTNSGIFYYTGSYGAGGGSGGGTPANPTDSVQFNNAGNFGGDGGFIFDNDQDASLFVDGPITASNVSASNIISGSDIVATDKFKLANTSYPVSIVQNSVGGTATMEFTTTDDTSAQATRVLLRGASASADIEIRTGNSGSEIPLAIFGGHHANFAVGDFGIGNDFDNNTSKARFIVSGNMSTTGSTGHITASGDIVIGQRYSASDSDNANGKLIINRDNTKKARIEFPTHLNNEYNDPGYIEHYSSFDEGVLRFSAADNSDGQSNDRLEFGNRDNQQWVVMHVDDEGGAGVFTSGSIESMDSITASSDISSSATVRGRDGIFSRDVTAIDDIFMGDRLMHYGDSSTAIGFHTDFIYLSASKLEFGGAVTASSDISASGTVFASTSLSSSHASNNVVLINTATGELYHTGSYGSGGTGGGISFNGSTTDGVVTFLNSTTANVETNLRFNNSTGLRVYENAQFNYNQNGSFGGNGAGTGYKAGQFLESGQHRTYVTPQRISNRLFYLVGVQGKDGRLNTNANYLVYTGSVFFDPTTNSGGGHGGGGGTPNDGTFTTKGRLQAIDSRERTGITISGNPGIFFFDADASASVSGSFNFDSASAQIKFDTGSKAIKFLAGSTTSSLTEVLHISESSGRPRVGIGTTTPLKALDFLDAEDSTQGTEILLRSSRVGEGAQSGDSAGRITFAINSASFVNVEQSGAVAAVEAKVVNIDQFGASGELDLKVSPGKTNSPVSVLKLKSGYDHELTGSLDMKAGQSNSGILSASLLYVSSSPGFSTHPHSFINKLAVGADPVALTGFTRFYVGADATFTNKVNIGNQAGDKHTIEGLTEFIGSITSSGNISSSGNFLGAQFKSHDKIVGLYHAGSDTIRLAHSTTPTKIYGTSLDLTAAAITASDISSSAIITALSSSTDYVQVNDKLEGNGPGFQFFAYNEDTAKVKFANWYTTGSNQYGMGMLWYETWFAAIDTDGDANDVNRRIGFYLEEPNAGATDTVGGTGKHPTNARFYVDVNGGYLSGSFTASADISASGDIKGNNATFTGDVTSNGYGIVSQSGDFVTNEFIVAASPHSVTSSDALAVNSDGDLGIGTPNPEVRLHMLGEAPQTTQILMEQFNDTADAPDIRTRRYRGTSASRADVQTNDYLFRLNVHGEKSGQQLYGSMRFDVDSTNADAMFWGLQTRDTAGTTADRITIDSSGDVNILGQLSINGISDVSASLAAAGTVDTSGTPASGQIAIFSDSDTIKGNSKFTFNTSTYELRVASSNTDGAYIAIDAGTYNTQARPYIDAGGLYNTLYFGSAASGRAFDFRNNKIAFDLDQTNTFIMADTSTPENLEIHTDGNIELRADDNLQVFSDVDVTGDITASGDISINDFPSVSASLAAASPTKPRFQVNGGCFLGQTAERAMPFGSSTGESTVFSYVTTYMIPANCKLLRVHTCSQSNAGTVTLKAYTIPDATADNTSISNGTLLQTVSVDNHNAGDPFEFTFGSTGTISKGKKFGLTVSSSNNPNGFRFTAYFEEV